VRETADGPIKSRELEEQLKTKEDREYWNKVKKITKVPL